MSANIGNANAVIFACCALIHILPASCVYRTCAVNCKQPFVIETQSIVIFWCCHCVFFGWRDLYFAVRIQRGSLILKPVIDHGTLTCRVLLRPKSTCGLLHHIHLH